VCVGFVSRHLERDLSLPKQRDAILEKALADLTLDANVLAIYLGGSLAKGKADLYSDIDLHTLVASE
jgi:predicted nucleotidyltransferase